jgi:type IV pilus assembly protein PilZ
MISAKPSVSQVAFKDKSELYAAYMDWMAEGGVFVPTDRPHRLGDDVYVLLGLPDDPQMHPVVGKVVWVTPARSAHQRLQGVGVRFADSDAACELKIKIETLLGVQLGSERPTQTL